MIRIATFAAYFLGALLGVSVASAQSGDGDWTTGGFDAQRSGWVRNDARISPEGMRKPGFDLLWKLNLKGTARVQDPLTPPVLIDFYIGYKGFRTLGFVGNSANTVIGIDTDLGKIEWNKTLGPATAGAGDACRGGMTSGVVRPTAVGYPSVPAIRGMGRSNPAKSGVGAPHEGAVTLRPAPRPAIPTPAPVVGATAGGTRRVAPPPDPFASRVQYVHAVTSDGKFHSLYISNGDAPKPAVQFLPANANAQGLIVFNHTAYVSTVNNCGGVDNGVWALDLRTQKVSQWKAKGSGPLSAPTAGPDGTIYVTDGGELLALQEGTLASKGSYSIGRQQFTSPPLVFDFKGKDLIALTSNDGTLHLLDSESLSKPVATSAPFADKNFAAGGLASWQDSAGVRWILAPAPAGGAASAGFFVNGPVKNGSIVAWKVVEKSGIPELQPAWVSRDMVSPLAPIIVNGVVFAVSGGKAPGTRAVLYALESDTGKELWNSGVKISGTVRRGGLSAGGMRVYVASEDGTQYAFGFPIEH